MANGRITNQEIWAGLQSLKEEQAECTRRQTGQELQLAKQEVILTNIQKTVNKLELCISGEDKMGGLVSRVSANTERIKLHEKVIGTLIAAATILGGLYQKFKGG
jgi:hypothetical protein